MTTQNDSPESSDDRDESVDRTAEEAGTEEAPTTEAPTAETTDMRSEEEPTAQQLPPPPPPPPPPPRKRFLRSRDDRVIAGVAGGLGKYTGVDPIIIRIAAVVSVFFGGLGIAAYILAAVFVPTDDGTGRPEEGSRGLTLGRGFAIAALALVGLFGFGVLTAAATFATGLGYGLAVVGAIVLIGLVLIGMSFRGNARWLLVPALALTVGVGVATAADLDLEGGIGKKNEHPISAASIPDDGYELGVGRLAVDLRDIDWSKDRVLNLKVRLGIGEAIVAVPSNVCVTADAHAGAGRVVVAGDADEGADANLRVQGGATATPRLVLDADVDMGQIRVLNDSGIDIDSDRGGPFQIDGDGDDLPFLNANAKACKA